MHTSQPVWFSFAQPQSNLVDDPFTILPVPHVLLCKEISKSSTDPHRQYRQFSELIFTHHFSSLFPDDLLSLTFFPYQAYLKISQTFTENLCSNSILLHKLILLHKTTSFSLFPFILYKGQNLPDYEKEMCSRYT